jgi:eukaryotic-like serine/threonine-protein kinase
LEASEPNHWITFSRKSQLGGAMLGQAQQLKDANQPSAEDQFHEAERLLVAGYEGIKSREGQLNNWSRTRLTEAVKRLVSLYAAWDKPDVAAKWRQELEAMQSPRGYL